MNPVNLKALPYRIRMIAEKLGMEATYQLLAEHGAECHTIPASFSPGCALAKHLGEDAAKVLCQLWPDTPIDLPKPDKILLQWRDAELIHNITLGGMTVMQAVKKYNLTRQRINQILSSHWEEKNLSLPLDLPT
ncbi:Mor transcription activator family protein [Bowmanella dokdonensis]|uniref:Mor transcription activator domain-containing protein n=1 Tax=Bowmanella dokdonensis TaxID=751969 RepID=A0A939DM24_9ALTE|nr:Mor transcription activator family protein [Bowmanella dokdonensis]MBN7824742.1 hypothetical protein [Bowmanella dokdonensis]